MRFPLGAMTFGDILDRGIKLLFARLPLYYIIYFIVASPVIIALVVAIPVFLLNQDANAPAVAIAFVGLIILAVLATLLLQPIATAAILYVVMQEYKGERATLGQSLSFAFSRFGSLLGASILRFLIIFVGILCCCVPGIYLGIMYTFVGQVVVLEKLGPTEGLSRSYSLITGYRLRVFLILLAVGIINLVAQFGISSALNLVLPSDDEVVPGPGVQFGKVNVVNKLASTVIEQLIGILFTTYMAICTTLLYLDIRIRKEGFDLELASELDEEPSERDGMDDEGGDDDRPGRGADW